jgi:hypothetical protein
MIASCENRGPFTATVHLWELDSLRTSNIYELQLLNNCEKVKFSKSNEYIIILGKTEQGIPALEIFN